MGSGFNPWSKSGSGDQMYQGVTTIFGGKPIEIKSKGHYKELLKSHGMPDASPRECIDEARRRKKSHPEQSKLQNRKLTEKILDKCHKDGIDGKYIKGFINKMSKDGIKIKDIQC